MANDPEPVTQASVEVDDGSADEPSHAVSDLGARPAADQLVRRVARAKIAGALFARTEQVRLGRYHLLEMVGAGGMGVVWGAWDPELERRVAIKLLKATMDSARERILREGQALAKLAHPNVVPVYDVGVVDEQVYLVMEWVRGPNLRAYCAEPHTLKEVLAVYRAAGDGLAAAHRAGLIHRDFKPDNAILGDDGRVRVLDFGLARGEVVPREPSSSDGGDLTAGAGTPRYMPPEQAEGSALTPAADQYAFCVSLREALVHRGGKGAADAEVPAWIDAVLTVGTAAVPDRRHASMEDVLRLLARDPARIWRNRLLVAGAVAATGSAFAIGSLRSSSAPPELERCAGGAAEIGRSWSPTVRGSVTASLQKLGPYGVAEARRLGDAFDAMTKGWAEAHHQACIAREVGTLTPALYERNLGCLARVRVALETAVELLQRADTERLPDTVAAAGRLPDAARCLTETQTSTNIAPPSPELAPRVAELGGEVERGRVLAIALDPRAIEQTRATAATAAELGYLPLAARAQLEHGVALAQAEKPIEAIAALDAANSKALEANDDASALEAYAYMIAEIGKLDDAEVPAQVRDRLGAVAMAEAIGKRLGASGAYVRALLYNNLGQLRQIAKDRAGARAWFARAREEQKVTVGHPELGLILTNAGLTSDDPDERNRLRAEGLRELARGLGPDHPFVLAGRVANAQLLPDPARSAAELREPCERLGSLHPHLLERISSCRYELAYLAEERGDAVEARRAADGVATQTHEGPVARAYALLLDGKLAEAVAAMTRFADERSASTNPVDQMRSADALLLAALAQERLAPSSDAARGLARRALAAYGKLSYVASMAFYQRRLARTRALAARLAPSDPDARELAREALAWYRSAGGYERAVAELAAFTGSR